MLNATALIGSAWAEGLHRPARLSPWQWADRYRRLPTKGASEPGPWRTSRVPYTREIMDCLGVDHPARRVILMKSVQSGGTEIGLNWVGSIIHTQQTPIMVVQPTIEMGERWSKQRLASMIADSPELQTRIAPARSRDSGNTILLKEWPGGVLIISGANSAASLRSMPARYLFCDEIDAYPIDLSGEGDPVSIAEGRTTTFQNRKLLLVSTPTEASSSRIYREWLNSDQRHYYIPCPECGEYQRLEWDNLSWAVGQPKTVVYACINGCVIREYHKTAMLDRGEWRADHPDKFSTMHAAGFHINALYSPIGLGLSWAELATDYEMRHNDPAALGAFTNLRLGLPTTNFDESVGYDELQLRGIAGHPMRTIPDGCLILTAAVDVQRDRFAILIVGWGKQGEMWIIDWVELPGNPLDDADWQKVLSYLKQPLLTPQGAVMPIRMTAIDCGFLQNEVIAITRKRESSGLMAVKGSSRGGRPILGKPTYCDYRRKGQIQRNGGKLWITGTDAVKEKLFLQLLADRDKPLDEQMIRFPQGLDESLYTQLTAETWDAKKRRWVKIRDRNEALDLICYATAAAHHPSLRLHLWTAEQWDTLRPTDTVSAPISTSAPPAAIPASSASPPRPKEPRHAPSPSSWRL